jgi:uncharacterized phiE125 gp8 family phage protein
MTLILVTGPATEPLTLAEAKSWLRVDGTTEDGLIQSLITSARLAVEAATNRLLIAQQWRWSFDAWPDAGFVFLPLTPVRAISRIRVVDALGGSVDVASSLYRLDAGLDRARLGLGASLPQPAAPGGSVWIDISAGYGDATAVPEPLRLAMRQLVARWFATRGDEEPGVPGLPASASALLAPYRVRRLA